MSNEQLQAAWAVLEKLDTILSSVGSTNEEWNLFTKIQAEVNEAKQAVSDQQDLLAGIQRGHLL